VSNPDTTTETARDAEIAQLRARVTELEHQLVETEAWANRQVAAAQESVYWLDRWHIDLNAVMQRPGASQFRAMIRAVRGVVRFGKRVKRRLPPGA
jgi:transposase InsO family protein